MTLPSSGRQTHGDSTRRFSDRVENYAKYRPGYPSEVLTWLGDRFGLSVSHVVADIGSGTGILTKLLVDHGHTVHAVEPNREMRLAAERLLSGERRLISHDGTAEATGIEDAAVDWITVAQAYHWFDVVGCRREFARILRPGGHVALLWNNRRHGSGFLQDYERFLQEFGLDYSAVQHQGAAMDGRIEQLFAPKGFEIGRFPHEQRLDFQALSGRTLSASYMPGPDQPHHAPMMKHLEEMFNRHAGDDGAVMGYETVVYVGRVG